MYVGGGGSYQPRYPPPTPLKMLLYLKKKQFRSRARAKLGYDPRSSASGELEQEQGDAKQLGYDGVAAGEEVDSITNAAGHVNFFQNLENGEKMTEVKKIFNHNFFISKKQVLLKFNYYILILVTCGDLMGKDNGR